jgi:branched-chain amino acid transport system permease protein
MSVIEEGSSASGAVNDAEPSPLSQPGSPSSWQRFVPKQANASLIVGLMGAAAVLLWTGANGYRESLLILGCLYALVALGMYVPFVLTGTLSMAYSAYAAIGGYTVAVMVHKEGLPLWVGWFVAPAISAVLAVLLGLATRRVSGFYLVAVTLLFAEAFSSWVQSNKSLTGGESGFANLPSLHVFGWSPTVVQFGIASVGLVCVVAYLVDRLRLSPWGLIVRSMREVPQAVEASGVRVTRIRLVALAIGAIIGSLAGSLFISSVHSVNPLTFTLNIVFIAVFMPIVGGVGTSWGSVVGAAIVTELTLNFQAVGQSGLLIVSVGVLVILLIAPRGVTGYIDSVRKWLMKEGNKAVSGRRARHH